MRLARRVLADPLTHFLAAGAALFAIFALLHRDSPGGGEDRTIVVDRAALVAFMQYQSAAFEPKVFEAQFTRLSPKDRTALIDSYVREEALVREARAMGLDRGDYVMRRRLVQKMQYLMDDAAAQTFNPTDAELRRYFAAHPEVYGEAPTVTFTHVFIDKDVDHPGGGEAAAERLKGVLEARGAGFTDAPGYGDRFAYLQNYVQRTPDFIENQFGHEFAATLQTLAPSRRWQGPIRSDYGWHLVLITERQAAAMPAFETVREEVRDDLRRETVAAYRETATADLARRYAVRLKGVSLAADRSP